MTGGLGSMLHMTGGLRTWQLAGFTHVNWGPEDVTGGLAGWLGFHVTGGPVDVTGGLNRWLGHIHMTGGLS
jgi:hypothetical protein